MFKKILVLLLVTGNVFGAGKCVVNIESEGYLWDEPAVEGHNGYEMFKYGYDPLFIAKNQMVLQNGIIISYDSNCYKLNTQDSIKFKKDFFKELDRLGLQRLVISLEPLYYTGILDTEYSKTNYLLDK